MAGHLPVKNTMFRLALLTEAKNELKEITEDFKRVTLSKFPNYRAMKLPMEYQMNEEHGLVDDTILCVERDEDILEFHLDVNGKINEIYLVM
ncbi:MAG: hypothetical protein GTO02_19490 [Candidatus Dadabacteria bacterium]|nr:hypothetical protein [Candidatus Dadabacteria bacterium]